MSRQAREELEEAVQALEREHAEWTAARIEAELAGRNPLAYGSWIDETPELRSRLRAVQRWRIGSRGRSAGMGARHLFPYVWPVGERQRKEMEPTFSTSNLRVSGSWRLFLYNCSPEVVRDVRVFLDRTEIDYAPSVLEGRFTEIHWQKVDEIRARCLAQAPPETSRHPFRAEFVIARGTRQATVDGDLMLNVLQGWVHFGSRDGRNRDLE
ncbi:MAG: hypothetical protein L3K15_03015 [Thermoplasmata archaeon]|nr:hypothetical protein [Thermoplasmata archaeon]